MADGVVFGSRAAPCCAWQVDDFRRFRDVGRWLSSSTRSQCGRSRREHPPPAGVCSVDATPVEHLVVLQHGLALFGGSDGRQRLSLAPQAAQAGAVVPWVRLGPLGVAWEA